MAIIIIGNDALEELRRELSGPRPEVCEKGGREEGEESGYALPCADMTCPCRIVRK
jgi:hypothetical protein